ncbi:MAG: hypothetical protein GYA62_02170 [Bacteroidales bacterium]|nr:hypothetical protein [Bacteroidales bacterium]
MMLDFSKMILTKVSFDPKLFHKELRKLLLWLGDDKEEVENLYELCSENYGDIYGDIISEEFKDYGYLD